MKAKKIGAIVIAWMLVGVLITLYDHFVLYANFSKGTVVLYTFAECLLLNVGVAILAAVTGGSFLVLYVNEKYHSLSYSRSVLLVVGSFVVVSSSLVILVSLGQALIHRGIPWQLFLFDSMHLKNMLVWSVVVALTQLTLQINDKFGQGILLHLITGRYHSPREETRIFMIVDIVSSTAIAEKLSRDQYHLFLRDFFADITSPILKNHGEIYQYVGDEIVISWTLDDDQTDTRCLQCYFDIRETISLLKEKYLKKFGLIPEFKAGLHYGKVIAGEIGIIKRDITYSGDVLNTVSRIQGKCNEYKVRILTSDELLLRLPYEADFDRIPIGEIELRGKERTVSLSTLEVRHSIPLKEQARNF